MKKLRKYKPVAFSTIEYSCVFFLHDDPTSNPSRDMKLNTLLHIKISLTSSILGIVGARSTSLREIFLHLPQYKHVVCIAITQFWYKLGSLY